VHLSTIIDYNVAKQIIDLCGYFSKSEFSKIDIFFLPNAQKCKATIRLEGLDTH